MSRVYQLVALKCNPLEIYRLVSEPQNPGMLEDPRLQSHRKARLRELIGNAHGGVIARLADVIDRSESYIGRMLYPVDKNGAR